MYSLTKKSHEEFFPHEETHEFPHEFPAKRRFPHEELCEEFSFLMDFLMRISVPHEFTHEELFSTWKLAHFFMSCSWGNPLFTRTSWGFFHEELLFLMSSSWVSSWGLMHEELFFTWKLAHFFTSCSWGNQLFHEEFLFLLSFLMRVLNRFHHLACMHILSLFSEYYLSPWECSWGTWVSSRGNSQKPPGISTNLNLPMAKQLFSHKKTTTFRIDMAFESPSLVLKSSVVSEIWKRRRKRIDQEDKMWKSEEKWIYRWKRKVKSKRSRWCMKVCVRAWNLVPFFS